MPYRVVIAEGTFARPDIETAYASAAGHDIVFELAPMRTATEVAEATTGASAVVVTTNPLPAELLDALNEEVRLIARAGIGLDAIDLDHAAELGLPVVNFPDYCTAEVATHAVAMLLALGRRLPEADGVARGDWASWSAVGELAAVQEWTVAVAGCGRIGRAVIDRLRPLVSSVRTFDPYASTPVPGTTTCATVDEALDGADALTLHVPLTAETRGMIGAHELAQLRPGAVVVNVSRGGLIDEDALASAARQGRVRAGLDVLEVEPPPHEHPLLGAPNVLLSPHVGWFSASAERRLREMAVDTVVDYLDGKPLRHGQVAVQPEAPR